MGSLQKYGGYSLDALAKEESFLNERSVKSSFFKPQEGKNVIRVLPPRAGESPVKIVSEHFLKLADGHYVFACPREMLKRNCPVCEEGFGLVRMDNEEDKKRGKDMLPNMKFYMNVIDRKNPDRGPLIFAAGKSIYDALKTIRKDPDIGGDFTDPESGFDIVIERTGTGLSTSYQVMPARNQSSLKDDGDFSWIEQQVDLSQFTVVPSADEIMRRLAPPVQDGEIRAEVVEEKKPKKRRPKIEDMGDADFFDDDDMSLE